MPMARTSSLRRQHDVAIGHAAELRRLISDVDEVPADATPIVIALGQLAGILRIHLAQEDNYLYPSIIASDNRKAASIARSFVHEMGQIGPIFFAFIEKWRSPRDIARDWTRFRAEADSILAALGDRIRRENDELYPLADQIWPMAA